MRFSVAVLLLFICTPFIKSNNDSLNYPQTREYTATRIENPPKIDGVLEDDAWTSEGIWHGDFIQQIPYEGQKATFPTEIKILYNTDYLYVAMRCYDGEPGKIRRIFKSRDVFAGDVAGIALDTYYDKQTAFEFNLTSAGQKIDLKHRGNYRLDRNWNAIWEGKTALEDSAWTAEFRIPFSQVRYSNREEQVWGLHIWRWLDRKKEESQWKLIPINAPAMVYLFGELKGINTIRNSRQVELLPYGLMKMVPATGENNNPYGENKQFFPNAGFDAKIGLSPNFTLDATVNPDFGQVEADPSVLNLTAYETFYEEKRPFFLEGDDIFDFRISEDRLYYSRRIGQAPGYVPEMEGDHYMRVPDNSTILGAAKVTGKTSDGLSVGIMESVTSKENAKIYYPEGEQGDTVVAPLSNYFIARIMQEKNQANTIFGGIFSATNKFDLDSRISTLTNNQAYTGGIDFQQNFRDRTYFAEGKFLFSHLEGNEEAIQDLMESPVHLFQRPDASHLSSRYDTTKTILQGTGGYLAGGKKGGKWRFSEEIQWRTPGLDLNDVGYLRQADFLKQETEIAYRETDPGKTFRMYVISFEQTTAYSFGGELVEAGLRLQFENQFHNLWGTNISGETSFPSLETRELRGGPALRINARNNINFHFHSNTSKDFYFSGGSHYTKVNSEPSVNFVAHMDFTWHPIRRIMISPFLLYILNNDEYQYIETQDEENTPLYLMGRLEQHTLEFTLRAEIFFTPEISLQYYGSPYFSTGHYSRFHRVNNASAKETSDRYYSYSENEVGYDDLTNTYTIQEINSESINTFDNPDFSFSQFRSNLVFRWEYKLGSVIYLVWSHNRTSNDNFPDPSFSENFNSLLDTQGSNIFLIKINYWFSI